METNELATVDTEPILIDSAIESKPKSIRGNPAWIKGQSANPGGRPKIDYSAKIARLVLEADPAKLQSALSRCMYEGLKKGDIKAWKEIAVRAYGKVPQPIEHAGANGGPIEIIFGVDCPQWLNKANQDVSE